MTKKDEELKTGFIQYSSSRKPYFVTKGGVNGDLIGIFFDRKDAKLFVAAKKKHERAAK